VLSIIAYLLQTVPNRISWQTTGFSSIDELLFHHKFFPFPLFPVQKVNCYSLLTSSRKLRYLFPDSYDWTSFYLVYENILFFHGQKKEVNPKIEIYDRLILLMECDQYCISSRVLPWQITLRSSCFLYCKNKQHFSNFTEEYGWVAKKRRI
jgi:hypothetical protein